MNRNLAFLFSALSAFLFALASTAEAAPVYRESFQFCVRSVDDPHHSENLVGWKAFRKTKPVGGGGHLKSSALGSSTVLVAFRSDPIGRTAGNLLWTKPTTGLTMFTDEFSFDIASITTVQYEQRFEGFNASSGERDGSRLALLVGNTWYISDQLFRMSQRSVWETVSVTLSGLTFGTVVAVSPFGPAAPLNSGVSLPSTGTVSAFGVYIPKGNGRLRIDNFTLSDNAPDGSYGPGEDGNLLPCPQVVAVDPEETPNLTPTGSAPTPTGSNPTPTGPVLTPTGSNPTPIGPELTPLANPQPTPTVTVTPKPKPNAKFCSKDKLATLGALRIKRKLKRDVVLNLPARSLKGRRDQALLSLIVFANPRIDLLTNLLVSDYDLSSGVLSIPTSVRPDGYFGPVATTENVALNRFARRFMRRYLKRYAKDGDQTKPLFPRVDRGTEELINTGLCTKQFRRLLRLRAKRVGVTIKFNP